MLLLCRAGWNVSALQQTVSECTTFDSCPHVTYRPDAEASQCGLENVAANSPYVTEHLLGVLPSLIQGGNTSVVRVNPFGAVNTVASPPVCSTFLPALVDYSTASPASYNQTVPKVPANAVYLQAGGPTSCGQSYTGWQNDASYANGGGLATLSSSTAILYSPLGARISAAEAAFPVFSTNRVGVFSYTIPVPAAGQYGVRLLFAENYWTTLGSRVFSVAAQGVTVLLRLDLNAVGPNPNVACTQGTRGALTQTTAYIFNTTVQVTAASRVVQLDFIRIADNPMVSAVEVFPISAAASAPSSPASTSTTRPSSPASTSAPRASSPTPTSAPRPASAFSLYINAGSSTGFTDAQGRKWQADTYVSSSTGTWSGTPNSGHQWTNTTADLYALYNSNVYNARYALAVPSAGSYRLTLHYGEMYWSAVGKRVFNVSVQGAVAVSRLDLIAATGYEYSAYTTAHTVQVTAAAGLSVAVALTTLVDNALLSGVELVQLS